MFSGLVRGDADTVLEETFQGRSRGDWPPWTKKGLGLPGGQSGSQEAFSSGTGIRTPPHLLVAGSRAPPPMPSAGLGKDWEAAPSMSSSSECEAHHLWGHWSEDGTGCWTNRHSLCGTDS